MHFYRIVLTLALLLFGCSSASEPMAFELSHPMAPPEVPFTVSGESVGEGLLCEGGTWVTERMEDMSGATITQDDWAVMFDAAIGSGGIVEGKAFNTFSCEDGSGTIEIETQARLDFGETDPATFGSGTIAFGTFEVSGTGDYASITGSGDFAADFDVGAMVYTGEVQEG